MPRSIHSASGAPYPERPAERDRWVLGLRGPRNAVDLSRAVATLVEEEPTERGVIASIATLFLANRECPWRCLMCDLWKNTTAETVPRGSIPAQIRGALASLPGGGIRRVKLYNSGSFFDPRAVPPEDHGEIASALSGFERVIVESHPALVDGSCERFRDLLGADLEVAVGLETAHPEVLSRLNKRMTVDDFLRAAERLRSAGIGLRVFLLLGLPFVSAREALSWTCRSIEVAFDAGATAVSIIPTRTGNGVLDALEERGEFEPPTLGMLEEAAAFGIRLGRGRVFADLWDRERLRRCASCFPARAARLRMMNLAQVVPPAVACACGA